MDVELYLSAPRHCSRNRWAFVWAMFLNCNRNYNFAQREAILTGCHRKTHHNRKRIVTWETDFYPVQVLGGIVLAL